MLLEAAIGDAYGSLFEFAEPAFVQAYNSVDRYVERTIGARRGDMGRYSGNTQLAIAITEVILNDEPWTNETFAEALVRTYRRDRRLGYPQKLQSFLEECREGAHFLAGARPASDKSGAAMRSLALGFYPDINEAMEKARTQGALTHRGPGLDAAAAVACATHAFLYGKCTPAELPQFVTQHIAGPWKKPFFGAVGLTGVEVVHAALMLIGRYKTFHDILNNAIDMAGKTATVGALALGIASCSPEIEDNLDEELYISLENGTYGYGFLTNLDDRLYAKFDVKRPREVRKV
jgi:ADP-ribosyl-[dinitrogen reductase] hydrolase